MNEEMLSEQVAQLQTDIALLKKQVDGVFKSYRYVPYEQIKHLGLQQLIDTRYIPLEAHNDIVQRLNVALEEAYERLEDIHSRAQDV